MRDQLRVKVATADYLRETCGKEAERQYIDGIMLVNYPPPKGSGLPLNGSPD